MRHIPVLLNEIIEIFKDQNIKIFVDATVGAGGHAKEILKSHNEIEEFIAIDRDKDALEIAKESLKTWNKKIKFFHINFDMLDQYVDKKVDGILFDIGMSSMQLEKERGFSFKNDGPLDMRMDQTQELSAEKIVNEFSKKDLERIFKEYGQEPKWKRAAKEIIEKRRKSKITTTLQLADILKRVCAKKRRIHPATRVFQALRIFVNDELDSLKIAIEKAIEKLNDKKKIVVISFHSLEDRIVKNIFKNNKKVIFKKLLKPSREEIFKNPRSRSAKLRIAERI